MKRSGLRISPMAIAACASLLAVSCLLSGCANMVATAPSVPIKTQIGGIKGLVHGGRGPVVGANVYLYSPSLTGYGGSGIAASTLNASTPLLNNSVPSSCGIGATATATADPVSGAITGITVTAGGAGYFINGVATPPIVTITDPTGTGATATTNLGTSPNGSGTPTSGWVQNFTITNAGTGYTAPVVTITPASTNPCQDANGNYYVNSDQNGNFALSGDYACTAGLPVYAYTIGGDTGGGAAGDDGFMAVLGICPASGNMATVVPYVNINELTTVAAAYSLAGFATDPLHIGVLLKTTAPPVSTLASLNALEMTGLTNAFNTAGNLYNVALQSSSSPTTTPNGNGTLPYKELNTLADVLANCVNSVYINYACETLLSYTPGQTDTAGAAIYIAQHPGSNVSNIFALATANGSPWQPMLTTAPPDWTVGITYTGGGLTATYYTNTDSSLAIDASGNVYNAQVHVGTVSKLSNLGVPLGPTSSTAISTGQLPNGIAIDINGNAWTANYTSNNLSEITPGSTTATTVTPSGVTDPMAIAFDGSGNMFVAGLTNYVYKLTSAGVYTSKTSSGQEGMSNTSTIAVQQGASGNVFAGSQSARYASVFSNSLGSVAQFTMPSNRNYTLGTAADAAGNLWYASSYYTTGAASTGVIEKIVPGGTYTGTAYTPGTALPYVRWYCGLAVDGGNNIWVTDQDVGQIYELNDSGTSISPAGFGYSPPGNVPTTSSSTAVFSEATNSIAVDSSGNVWIDGSSAALWELVGAATPTVTPIAYATANSLNGQRP